MTFTAEQKSDDSRHSNNAIYIARLKPGAALQQAQSQIDALNAANLERFPQFREVIVNAGFRTVVNRLQDQMVKDVSATLYLMWGGSLFVLLIGCVNVANLALSDRRAEAVADALTNVFGIPPENLATQGYGERYLKIKTDEQERLNRRVVIRILSPAMCDAKEIERFRREARTLAKLESEHVARIFYVSTESDRTFYFVRQYLEGQDLAAYLRSLQTAESASKKSEW